MKSKGLYRLLSVTSFVTLTLTQAIHAASGTWLGNSGSWNDTATWSAGSIADGVDSFANFTGVDITTDQTVTLGVGRTIGNISFADATTSSNNLLITGNTLTLDVTTGIPLIDVSQSDRTLTISSELGGTKGLKKTGAGNLIYDPGASTSTFAGLNINGGTMELKSGTINVSGGVDFGANPQGFSVANEGTFRLNGGNVNLTDGGSYLFPAGVYSTGTFILDNGTFDGGNRIAIVGYGANGTTTINAGQFIAGQFQLGASTSTSSVSLNGGILQVNNIANGGTSSTVNFNGGTLKAKVDNANFVDSAVTTAGIQAGGAVIDSSGFNITIAKSLTEDGGSTGGGLTKIGDGQLILSNSNSYTGITTISAGTLALGNADNTLPDNGAVVVDGANAILAIGGNSDTVGAVSLRNGGSITGVGGTLTGSSYALEKGSVTAILGGAGVALTKTTSDTVTLSGTNTYTGSTSINGGRLEYGNLAAVGSTSKITVNNDASVRFNAQGTVNTQIDLHSTNSEGLYVALPDASEISFSHVSLLSSGSVFGYGSDTTVSFTNGISGTGGLTYTGYGYAVGGTQKNYMVLSGSSAFSGDLAIYNYAGSAQVNLSGGNDRLPTTTVVYIGALGADPTNVSALNLNGNNQTIAGISDAGNLAGARRVVNASGTAATLTLNTAGNQTFSGNIGGSDIAGIAGDNLSLVKSGEGAQTLSGVNTYTGDTTVTGGSLAINGSSIKDSNKLIISGGTVNLTGSETVNTLFFGASQQAAGTYSATGASGTIASANFTGSGTLVVISGPSTGFASWIATPAFSLAPGNQGVASDPENDGMTNLLEYALNGNPSVSDRVILPALNLTPTDFEFTYSRLDLSLADTTQTFEYGSTLAGWTPILIPAEPGVSTVGIATVTITDMGATDSVKVSISKSAVVGAKLFGRLKVVK